MPMRLGMQTESLFTGLQQQIAKPQNISLKY